MNKLSFGFLFSVFILMFFSCVNPIETPYVISNLECKIEDEDNLFSFAGVLFSFTNISPKTINYIEINFNVFDSKTLKSPFIASNHIVSELFQNIESNETITICISLDENIHCAPEEPYLIDQFYIKTIKYDDGSKWVDNFGAYAICNF